MEWKDARKNPPKNSGDVVIMLVGEDGKSYSVQTVEYSLKHRAFNANDSADDAKYAIQPDFWAEMPKPPKEG